MPKAERIFLPPHAGFTFEEIVNLTKIDRWLLMQIKEILDFEEEPTERRIRNALRKNLIWQR